MENKCKLRKHDGIEYCDSHNRRLELCKRSRWMTAFQKEYLDDVVSMGEEFLEEFQDDMTPEIRYHFRKAMDLELCTTEFNAKNQMICITHRDHGQKAGHVATDGDDDVCEFYAQRMGCHCCDDNCWDHEHCRQRSMKKRRQNR